MIIQCIECIIPMQKSTIINFDGIIVVARVLCNITCSCIVYNECRQMENAIS